MERLRVKSARSMANRGSLWTRLQTNAAGQVVTQFRLH
jgi:hypothetical protein